MQQRLLFETHTTSQNLYKGKMNNKHVANTEETSTKSHANGGKDPAHVHVHPGC